MLAAISRKTTHRSLSANLIQQFSQLRVTAAGSNSFSTATGFSCASPNSSILNLTSSVQSPVFQQKRHRKFILEDTHNFKHKGSRKNVFRPYFKWDFRQLEGEEYTHKPFVMRKLHGRNPETGEKVNQRIGGGFDFDFFWVDLRRNRFSSTEGGCYEERILEVRRAPNMTAYVALAAGSHGRRWILATDNMKAGDVVRSYNYMPAKMLKDYEMPEGDSWPIGALPVGTVVCNIQKKPSANFNVYNDKSDYFVINAGGSVSILRHQGEFTVILFKKTREIAIKRECVATIGKLSHGEFGDLHWGSMNMKRRWGIRQGTGVWHKKDGYCGRKAHPLKKMTVDPEKEPPLPMKIPITFEKRDMDARFGNAKTMPQIYAEQPYDYRMNEN